MKTQHDIFSVLVDLLADRSLGLQLVASVADLISVDARFNLWIASEGKRDLGDEEMLEVIDEYEDARTKCCTSIEEFKVGRDEEPLEAMLREITEALTNVRSHSP